ncbi:uncharacterized protein LTR77_010933 [Saxophila tyrrhenica]|uniref:Sm domain-containing protein n=1 Tax=Saxophila tyrrhenica TaxID=1690608 RepID=A0AAV9NU46_9PEZI|nr:hypothetical protein LTR77_010933 [Saxophila tyrrhenica]
MATRSASNPTGTPAQATAYLTSLLNKTLHIHISDGRMFVGQLKCTDNERNIILAMTHEYRQPSKKDVERAAAEHEASEKAGKVKVDMKKRFVGLVVVPGRYIEKVEVEGVTLHIGAANVFKVISADRRPPMPDPPSPPSYPDSMSSSTNDAPQNEATPLEQLQQVISLWSKGTQDLRSIFTSGTFTECAEKIRKLPLAAGAEQILRTSPDLDTQHDLKVITDLAESLVKLSVWLEETSTELRSIRSDLDAGENVIMASWNNRPNISDRNLFKAVELTFSLAIKLPELQSSFDQAITKWRGLLHDLVAKMESMELHMTEREAVELIVDEIMNLDSR